MTDYPIGSAEHALIAGTVAGIALRHGIRLIPDTDDDGNYLASMTLEDDALPSGIKIRIIVPPPPSDG